MKTAEVPKKRFFSKHRFFRYIFYTMFGLVLLLAILALIISQFLPEYGLGMNPAKADWILKKSIEENDVDTFLAINEQYYLKQKFPLNDRSEVLQLIMHGQFSDARQKWRLLGNVKSFQHMLIPFYWMTQGKSTALKQHPRLREAVLKRFCSFSPRLEDDNATAVQDLMRLYDSQLLTGQAIDQLFDLFLITGDYNAIADYVIKSMDQNLDTRGLEPILVGYMQGDPQNPFVQRGLGLLRWSQGRFDEALPLLQFAAMHLDQDPVGRFAWADTRITLGLPIDPVEIMGEISRDDINYNTQDARRFYFLAKLQERQGEMQQAIDSLKKSIALQPTDPEPWVQLGSLNKRTAGQTGEPTALPHGELMTARWNRLKKAAESFRNGDHSAENVEALVETARQSQWSDVAQAFEKYNLPTRGNERIRSLKAAIRRDEPVKDLFFLARPQLRPTPIPASQWKWLNSTAARSTVPSNTIQFVELPATETSLDYQYQSFATDQLRIADVMGGGVAVLDFNKDGLMDLYFPGGCDFADIENRQKPGSSRLYKNLGDFKFEDVTKKSGMTGYGYLMGAAVGDFNNDTWPDLFVTGYGTTILYKNRGDGTFEDVTDMAGVRSALWTTAAAFADLDADGDSDLFAATYVDAPLNQPETCVDNLKKPIHCSPGKFSAQADLLWENLGNGTFRDISESSGIAAAVNGRGLGLSVADLDDDGRLDLFIANDASPNFYFHQDAPLKFHEMAAESGLAVDGSGKATASMGVVADDLDEDGLLDIFHTNFLNEPNTFRKNLGGGLFHDSTFAAGLSASSLARTGFGTAAFDADLDGHTDLFITNGHLDNQPHINNFMQQLPLFYRGLGKKGFQLIPSSSFAYLSRSVVGRGMASADFNNDGRVDLLIVHRDEPVALLANQSAPNHQNQLWVSLELQSAGGGPAPVGTVVEVQTSVRLVKRWVTAGTGYLSTSDPRFVFAVDPSEKVLSIKIHWPAGNLRPKELQSIPIPKMNAYHAVRRP